MIDNLESIQILNTAIIKSREKKINNTYEERLKSICNSPAIEAINRSIIYLAEKKNITRDQSAIEIIDTIRELDSIWKDYVMMEGIEKLKKILDNDD